MSHAFQVDLRGMVDLLSHHLYGSPRVYVRELLQNAVDAITARRAEEPDAPSTGCVIEPPEVTGDGTLRVHDTGIGLTEAQVHELLATIGRSSKRDELGFARHEFLGQFGIGLLSCFLVADEIEVLTRAAGAPTVRWTGLRRRPVRGQRCRPTQRPEPGHHGHAAAAAGRRAVADRPDRDRAGPALRLAAAGRRSRSATDDGDHPARRRGCGADRRPGPARLRPRRTSASTRST